MGRATGSMQDDYIISEMKSNYLKAHWWVTNTYCKL